MLTDAADAAAFGAERLEQGDVSVARDGSLLLIVTPISDSTPVQHAGCIVFSLDDVDRAALRRDDDGALVPRAILTGDATFTGPGSGPGLCTYDAASDTGVMMITKILRRAPFDLEFVLRATAVHP